MQSQDVEEIKAALWLQAFHGCTQVRCGRTATWRGSVKISRICASCCQSGSALPSAERAVVARKGEVL